ncbi:Hypothetical predicted protein [Lecanosticta acicola]|uniref:Uncharacterized protein n=1 Tax=Lecanosticta acicola TaxID=111012 RepID=A0AAI9ECE5_9PEZI|nr:Hypothetical predicted protein [Lecanosticta acicola]
MEHPRTSTTHSRRPPTSFCIPPDAHRDNHHYSSTAYYGAAGNLGHPHSPSPNTPDITLDYYQDCRDHDPSSSSPTKEGIASRLCNLPTAAALTRSGSVLHSRAKSWTSYVSKLNTGNNNQSSSSDRSHNRQSNIFGHLFHGESAPVHLGVPTSPTKENEESEFVMEYKPGFTERPNPRHERKTSTHISAPTPATKGGKLSWFNRKQTQPAPASDDTTKDEILTMNLNTSLFPHGPADPLSPQAFNDLLLNATNLLHRMQTAYKEKMDYIASIQPEIDAQKEEVEEARTRSEHLKLQLEDIGRQHQEQKQVNRELVDAIAEQKMQLQEVREQSKTIRVVGNEDNRQDEEDEDQRRQRKRGSAGSDSGFESDTETSSLFSTGMETPMSHRQPNFLLTTPENHHYDTRRFSQQSTAYSKASSSSSSTQQQPQRLNGDVLEKTRLMAENEALRMRIDQMTAQFQGAIDFVHDVTRGV